ncbi:hypothetical protein [Streptomyces hydrogenans]|uniref:Uncharacterized protein n=1 Tax=Streptomyces hydrogenans TaxID=1873719 RepID=A0ABQ3PHE8_9ACTN|nr:hypothetical protein [Streptomyces hydrogenans]GHG19777.1 hypothetical protein GCM10018784_36230 [Streptomyces hydrogenans]GHI20365.1 hypothetical protein Shyd_17360 [Streptomyces hydrogenans]GHI22780.1 hypothetical protein Shyd_41510 [Streptomyces hydrogenans]GHI22855.1 hypothetical protein Shyd_42260 [Streptomyces hydrogenans]GHI22929.1 hypothetical protein Shyd_43000 [Streptomyces hydrogenans]
MRTIRRDGWTAADYDSEQILHQLGHRDAATRVTRARRARPLRRAWRTLRAQLHRPAATEAPTTASADIDWVAARAAADAVNRGDTATADRIVQATADPRGTAFAAFRFIDVH